MPTYRMTAPNGQTYQVDGPAGASDDDVRQEILRQHPDAGTASPPAAASAKPQGLISRELQASGIAPEYHANADAYRSSVRNALSEAGKIFTDPLNAPQHYGSAVSSEAGALGSALGAAVSPIMGPLHKQFGQAGGDLISMAVPLAGEVNAARGVNAFAKAAGITPLTAQGTLAASRGAVAATPAAAPASNALAQTVQQFDQAGVRPTLAAMGQGNARVAKAIAENPVAGIRARAGLQASINDTAQAANRVANQYGQPASRGAAGEAVQEGIQNFNKSFSQRAEDIYTPIFNKIDTAYQQAVQKAQAAAPNPAVADRLAQAGYPQPAPAPVIKPDATTEVLNDINARGDAPALKKLFQTPQVRTLTTATTRDANLLSFNDLRNARTWVRNAQRDPELRGGISEGDLQRLEGALTQDINTNAANIAGPKVARQLQQADSFYRLGSQRIQGALQRFVGSGPGGASGESAYDTIQRMASDRGGADTARLTALKKSLQPSEWGDVAASTIQRMGQAPDGSFSINRFVTNADTLSPQGKDLLFGTGDSRRALDNLVDVARKQKNVEQAANHSNTGSQAQAIATVAGLLNPHTTLPTVGALFGAGLTGEALTNPGVMRAVASLGRAKSPQAFASQAAAIRRLAVKDSTLIPVANAADQLIRSGQLPTAANDVFRGAGPVPAAASNSQAPAN